MTYNTNSRSTEQGWVLVTVVLLFLVIQAMAIAAVTVARYNMASSGAFYSVLQNTDTALASMDTGADITLQAPEGWDHAVFSTIVTPAQSTGAQQAQSYSWRVGLTTQPFDDQKDIQLSSIRPHIIVIVDDSSASFISQYTSTYKTQLAKLLDGLDLCQIAVTTTSQTDTALSFSSDIATHLTTLDNIAYAESSETIADRLSQLENSFPETCATSKHIILVTDGIDGKADCPTLHSVSCDCKSNYNIRVHTIGSNTDSYLSTVACFGNGYYTPSADKFFITCGEKAAFTTHIPVLHGSDNVFYFLYNSYGHFEPDWLDTCTTNWYIPNSGGTGLDSLEETERIAGMAAHIARDNNFLYCSTSRDTLVGIAPTSKELLWVIKGIGGTIRCRSNSYGDYLIVGPDMAGKVSCVPSDVSMSSIIWSTNPVDVADASDGQVFCAQGNTIEMRDIQNGTLICKIELDDSITSLVFDYVTSMLYVGTATGKIITYSYDIDEIELVQNGNTISLTTAGICPEPITDIRIFTWRKETCLAALTQEGHIAFIQKDTGSVTVAAFTGKALRALVMDKKVYLTTWQEGSGCGGFDTGTSTLTVYDALTGTVDTALSKSLLTGKAFGPLIDIRNEKQITYYNSAMESVSVDISSLQGVSPVSLGTQLTN